MRLGRTLSGLLGEASRRVRRQHIPYCRTTCRGWRVGAVAEAVGCPDPGRTPSFLHMTTISNDRRARLLAIRVYVRARRRLVAFHGKPSKTKEIAEIMPHSQRHAQFQAAVLGAVPQDGVHIRTTVTFKDEIDIDPVTRKLEGPREKLPVLEYRL